MSTDFIEILSDLAQKYQNTPEGKEKEELKKVIDKSADIIYGRINITDLNAE